MRGGGERQILYKVCAGALVICSEIDSEEGCCEGVVGVCGKLSTARQVVGLPRVQTRQSSPLHTQNSTPLGTTLDYFQHCRGTIRIYTSGT